LQNYYWTNSKTHVKKSNIHQLGRFALETIPKNETVIVAGGHVLDRRQHKWITGLQISEWLILQMPDDRPYEAFINHSCDPNVYITGNIFFKSLRTINAGEELTIDYATFMNVKSNIIEKCMCNSKNCRVSIPGDGWKDPHIISNYVGKRSDYIDGLINDYTCA
jgi:uncharacterized protein